MQRLDLGWDADWCSCWCSTGYLGRGVPQHPEMWCPNCMFLPWDWRCKYPLQLKLSSVAVVEHGGLIFIMPVMNSLLLEKMGKSFLGHFYPKAQQGNREYCDKSTSTAFLCLLWGLHLQKSKNCTGFSLINALSSGPFTYSCFTVFPG